MEPKERPLLAARPINEAVLRDVYASDQDMYPVPLTYAQLQAWVASCHDLSASLTDPKSGSADLIGVIIVLPVLRRYWEDLMIGKIKETEIHTAMFPGASNGDAEVGLHVFHIERFVDGIRGFAELAMKEVMTRANSKNWRVVGLSALTVTPAGKKTFRRMGFESTGYTEMFLEKGGEVRVAYSFPGEVASGRDGESLDPRTTAEMMAKRF